MNLDWQTRRVPVEVRRFEEVGRRASFPPGVQITFYTAACKVPVHAINAGGNATAARRARAS